MKKVLTKTELSRVDSLYKQIAKHINTARSNIMRAIDTEQVKAYWLIGRDIIEEEQAGKERAEYGLYIVKELSDRLNKEFGRGFSVANIKNFRQFYLTYSSDPEKSYALRSQLDTKKHAVRAKSNMPQFKSNLGWTHYRSLMRLTPQVRTFYEIEASKNNWSSRELDRQIGSLLFERLAKSKDKEGLMKLACNGQEIQQPADAIKEPLVLEFLNIPESNKLAESKLEEALISKLQNFLLELGRGFAFVGRQKRLTIDGKHFFCDLVFYHTILKCYVLLDLKTHELTHSDLGQMQLYRNYYDMECLTEGDNPTIGIILCSEKSDEMVKYFLGDNEKIFTSKYRLNLPTKEELEKELKKELNELQNNPSLEKF